ncbi:hypothetical protein FIBSPDRAFT_933335 [Athelia psychrophila]|uniref:CENP-V/GFA domain-containing protein n=1 Tax=Athelia psychrophila TaxID=1759441 RepID=A0A166H6Q8_9AGAM|nr:hypothetical protein FIBSPDRAFT_933335 [Fibularhizoctonia sp. CBS 109695]
MPPNVTLSGGCMCGAITYAGTSLPTSLTNCYCTTCRILSGSSFITFASFPSASITFTPSPPDSSDPSNPSHPAHPSPPSPLSPFKVTSYSPIAERAHCAACGTPLYMQYKHERTEISVPASTIHLANVKGELPGVGAHIFVGEKAPWYEIPEDGLPRYEKFSEGFMKLIEEAKSVSRNEISDGPGAETYRIGNEV